MVQQTANATTNLNNILTELNTSLGRNMLTYIIYNHTSQQDTACLSPQMLKTHSFMCILKEHPFAPISIKSKEFLSSYAS